MTMHIVTDCVLSFMGSFSNQSNELLSKLEDYKPKPSFNVKRY